MLTEEMRTLELRTAGRCVCAVQAFCRRRNLGGGRIHFRRAFESPKGFAGHWPAKPKKKDTTKVVSFFLNYRNSIDARLSGLHLKPNRSPAQRVRFGKEEQQNERALTFEKKSRSKRYDACSDVEHRNTIDAAFL